MSTLKLIREIRRQAAQYGVTVEVDTRVKVHPKVTFTASDGRAYSTTIACSPKNEHGAMLAAVKDMRRRLLGG